MRSRSSVVEVPVELGAGEARTKGSSGNRGKKRHG